jgi:hypothetical protein
MRRMKWINRLRAISSPLLKPPAYRVLFVLVLVGALLIATLPEAAFVLPAIDAVGLDIVTILAALELRQYLATVALLVGIPASVAIYLRVPGLWPYACMWPVIWIRTLMGTMKV